MAISSAFVHLAMDIEFSENSTAFLLRLCSVVFSDDQGFAAKTSKRVEETKGFGASSLKRLLSCGRFGKPILQPFLKANAAFLLAKAESVWSAQLLKFVAPFQGG